MATAAGYAGQSHADVGRQSAGGFVADRDLHDLEPGRGRDHRVDGRRDGIHPAEG